jgi:TPR repeat protein
METMERLEHRCAFCREPMPKSQEEAAKRIMKRIKENNDPAAMSQMGAKRYKEGDYENALEYWTKAAELGNAVAHYNLSVMYDKGEGVEKDDKKAMYLAEEAAIGGHPEARHNLGIEEWDIGRFERAAKHFIIAANLGYEDSLKCVKDLYADGNASKEDYANALRGYQAAVDEAKSPERDEAETYFRATGLPSYF